VRGWLQAMGSPAGVLASDDSVASTLLHSCLDLGIKIPEDLALVGVDNSRLICETSQPSLSSVIVPAERIGYEAASLLDRMMNGFPPPTEAILLRAPGVFVRESSDTFAAEDPLVAKAIKLMQHKSHTSTPVADILPALRVSRRKLEYHFKAALGQSPGQVIRFLQLARAKQMMHTSHLPMATIAVHCGFTSARHLARAFRALEGVTPSQYRAKGSSS